MGFDLGHPGDLSLESYGLYWDQSGDLLLDHLGLDLGLKCGLDRETLGSPHVTLSGTLSWFGSTSSVQVM